MARERGTLHFLTPLWSRPQRAFVGRFRRYFERAPDWVLLTTRGRRTGLPREVLLPCRRIGDRVVVLSGYGRRADWIRNLIADPRVEVTCHGNRRSARAEVVDDRERKRELLRRDPFLLSMPIAIVQAILWTVLRPVYAAITWLLVAPRPLVVMRLDDAALRPPVGDP
ncbi:MAG TPA: nitroreductase family deazaflavin-dependent oxidoreductase [Candidatus Binatia bacterium]|nr:nitroreductase family deazaflavin-dependent oxidoreductase [Candidatus Binatia bacterium]